MVDKLSNLPYSYQEDIKKATQILKENGAKENSKNQQHLLVCYNSNLSGNQFLYECMAQNLDRLAVCRSPVCGCDRNRTDCER